MRVVIIGSGNLAEAMAIAITNSEGKSLELVQIFGRNRERLGELSALSGCRNIATEATQLAHAELYILAVSDTAIEPLSRSLPFSKGSVLAHTAGSVELDRLQPQGDVKRAVIYPMQTFTKGRSINFREVPLFVEAEDDETSIFIRIAAKALSTNVVKLSSRRRKSLHLAAVFACNFVNAMMIATADILDKNDLPLTLYEPLIRETIDKVMRSSGDPSTMQTGPAVRGDQETVESHLQLLSEQGDRAEELIEIYKIISTYIWETSKRI